ncbi:TetR/AcrR family transcriptional regulator [Microbacterium sp. M28]|uniref:TetR/AcrR family transcriptional regulator n=1 Tax=Microbacterium sp. M28 TaxID=2962064 RepID=UPI0021F45904|nr:TetR/AcrR family transcriptional regulator [Microbacterium sp. M28]UYO97162.1 TetR/AcrR family transcriptional regulator [Microbacterium sp. M28]
MTRKLSEYHQQIAADNRAAILRAAARPFLENGYDRTSLAEVARQAGVSRATLFKQFPTKAELFEATVLATGSVPDAEQVAPDPDDFFGGLVILGSAYVRLLDRPGMADLMRIVIAESPRFPELRERTFDFGTLPVLAALRTFLVGARDVGTARVEDADVISAQFLGMIATTVFWPRLVHGGWALAESEKAHVVEQAAETIAARCTPETENRPD